MYRIDRKDLRAPGRVLDIELATIGERGEEIVGVEQYNTVWCLSRIDGVPQEISYWDVSGDAIISIRTLCDQLGTGKVANEPAIQEFSPEGRPVPT